MFPLYDPNASCPKCGYDEVHTRWETLHQNGHLPGMDEMRRAGVTNWMARRCVRCGYIWREMPLDYKGPS